MDMRGMTLVQESRIIGFWMAAIASPLAIAAVLSARQCPILIYEPEVDPNYQLTERDREIRKAYQDVCHWSWKELPDPYYYVEGSGPVRPVPIGTNRKRKIERMQEEYGF